MATSLKKLLVVGSLNVDITNYVDHFPKAGETLHALSQLTSCGGKGANQVVMAGLMNATHREHVVSMIGAVGNDQGGKDLLAALESRGVDGSHVMVRSDERTGNATICVDQKGENTIIIYAGANRLVSPELLTREALQDVKVLVCQNEIPLQTTARALELAKSRNALTIFNPAPSCPLEDLPDGLLKNIDFLIPNETEAAIMLGNPEMTFTKKQDFENAIQELHKRVDVPHILLTAGGNGVIVSSSCLDRATWVPPSVLDGPVVDTSGAGDCFIGTFAHQLMRTDPSRIGHETLIEAIRIASAAASLSVESKGCQVSYPSEYQVMERLGKSS